MPIRTVLLSLVAAATLAACGEKPQNTYVSEAREQERDQAALTDGRRQRVLEQNEGNRIYNNGMMR